MASTKEYRDYILEQLSTLDDITFKQFGQILSNLSKFLLKPANNSSIEINLIF